jgi:hypothetical protein
MTDETEANAVTDASQAAATTGTQQSETLYSDKGRLASQNVANESDQDVGADEAVAAAIANDVLAYLANGKRTADEYQQESLTDIRRGRQHANNVDNLAVQALQNAVETANMVSKQAVRHSDIAIDRQWNVDEVSTLTAKSGVEADAIMAVLVNQIAEKLNA